MGIWCILNNLVTESTQNFRLVADYNSSAKLKQKGVIEGAVYCHLESSEIRFIFIVIFTESNNVSTKVWVNMTYTNETGFR